MTDMILAVRITADGRHFIGQMGAAQVKAAGLKATLGQTANEARDLTRATDATAVAQGRAAGAATRLAASEAEVAAAARLAAAAQVQAGAAATGVTGAVGGLSRGMGGLGLAVGGAVTAMGVAVTRSLDLGTNLTAMSRQLGVSTTAVQQFRYAARVTGIDVGALESNIGKLTLKIGQAVAGNREANNAFAALRVGFQTTDGAARSTEVVLRDVFAALAAIDDPAERARLGTALLGDEYQRIAPLLGGGAAGLAQFTAALAEQNRHLTDAQVATLAAANAEYEKMQNTLAVSIAGAVADNAEELRAFMGVIVALGEGAVRTAAQIGWLFRSFRGQNAPPPLTGLRRELDLAAPSQRRFVIDRFNARTNAAVSAGAGRTGITDDFWTGPRGRIATVPPAAGVAIPTTIGPRGRHQGGGGSAEAAARRAEAALERQRNLAEQIGVSIGRINDRWNEQPRLVNQAAQDSEALGRIIAELSEKKPPNWAALADNARKAQSVIQTGLLRPFHEMVAAAEHQDQLQQLVLAGREDEAEVLARIARLQEAGLNVTAEQRAEIERIVANEGQINDLLASRDAILGAYKRSIGDIRSNLEALLSGGSVREFGRNLLDNARHLRGELLTEQLFGQPLRDLEREIRQSTGLEGTVAALDAQVTTTVTSFGSVAASAKSLAETLNAAAGIGGGGSAALALDGGSLGDLSGVLGEIADAVRANDEDIVVTAARQKGSSSVAASVTAMRPNDYFARIAAVMTRPITQLLEQLDATVGTKLAGKLGGAITGGVAGFLSAGPVGAALGALNGSNLFGGKAGKILGQASAGAATGAQVAQIGAQFGLKTSATGGSLGGALGAATGLPGGDIIGSIIGSVVGGLFKKSPRGAAVLSSATGDAAITGNKATARDAVGSLAGSVQGGLQQIADQLGGVLGAFSVSVGSYKDSFRVSASGSAKVGDKKYPKGAGGDLLYDGKDAEAAVRAAILNAIADGGVGGISAAMQKALSSSSNLENGLREALKVREVEDIIGGIGATLERQFRGFEAQAKDRVRIATQYGFDVVAIEARNADDRKKLVDQILDDRVGSLRTLLKDFAFGDLFEGSAADRRTALLGETAKAKIDAEAGKDGAAAKLADLLRQLAETSRDAYGTAGAEFASDRAGAISSAEKVIALENERIKAAQDAALGTKAALDTNNALTNESNDLLAQIVAKLDGLSGVGAAQVQLALSSAAGVARQVSL